MTKKFNTHLDEVLRPSIEALGYEYWGIFLTTQGRQSLLRVYIDKPGGVSIEDCSLVTKQVGAILDVEDPISNRYRLEVSSPGIDRPLFTLAQYQRYIDKKIRVKLHGLHEGRRNFLGVLREVSAESISLLQDEHLYVLPFSDIDRANVEPEF